ncbi:MAG: insulinase family protein [Bacteroidetes bacterium]|nr:insulinase family protein [Bacteroidota bacterium]
MINRTIAPKITNAVDFHLVLPPYKKYILKNGVEVFAIDLGQLDTLMVNWVFSAGNSFEEKNLIAATANHLLKNGTSKKTAFEINEHFEYYGSFLNRSCQNETAEINLHCLGRYVNELLPVIAEIVTDSIFPEEELDIYIKNMQQRLQVSLKKSDFVAGRLIDAYLFGEKHPYGKYSSMEDYASLQQNEIQTFYKKYYQQGHCAIFVAGKLPVDIIESLDRHFGSLPIKPWHAKEDTIVHPILSAKEKKYRVTNDENGVQGSVRIARNFPNRHHPDFQSAGVLNNIFGGYFGSRLMANIREDKGYTYGIHSYLLNHLQESAWMISTEAGKDVCEATIEEVYKEMELLRDELIDEEELQTARNFMIGTILGDLDGPFHVAARWKNIMLNGLDENYFYNGIQIIKTISAKELQELANKYLQPKEFYELVVV